MPRSDVGIVCTGMHEGEEVLGFAVTWDKRAITFISIATVLGLAFRAEDPDGLLGAPGTLGITRVSIPTSHPCEQRSASLAAQCGVPERPDHRKDVFIPLEWVTAAANKLAMAGRMLMECSGAPRSCRRPTSAKVAVRGTTAYAAMRKQFGLPIGKFEGAGAAGAHGRAFVCLRCGTALVASRCKRGNR